MQNARIANSTSSCNSPNNMPSQTPHLSLQRRTSRFCLGRRNTTTQSEKRVRALQQYCTRAHTFALKISHISGGEYLVKKRLPTLASQPTKTYVELTERKRRHENEATINPSIIGHPASRVHHGEHLFWSSADLGRVRVHQRHNLALYIRASSTSLRSAQTRHGHAWMPRSEMLL